MLIVLALATTVRAQRNNIHAKKLQLALYAIENLYVDTTSERKLVEDAIIGMLTEEEAGVFRRAKNAKTHSVAKHATLSDYKKATAFEALIGYLYLSGQEDRLKFLLKAREELCRE